MQLISKVKYAQTIPIITGDGKADSVNLQARSKLRLPEGAKLDPARIGLFKDTITIVGPAAPAPVVQADAPKQTQPK